MTTHVMVEHPNGEIYYTSDYGARIIDFIVPSSTWRHETQSIEGGNGVIPLLSTYEQKTIQLSFTFFAPDIEEYIEKRDMFNQIFKSFKTFFVSDSKRPGIRWGVRAEPFTIEREGLRGKAQIDLTVFSGHAESINVDVQIFDTSTFTYTNEGNELIDMNKQNETEIEFQGASTDLIIRNLSTGQEWSWIGNTIVDDVILLKGIAAKKNNTSIFGLSNRKTIDLVVGDNDFEIVGATGDFTLTMRTRFYYL
jgi:hypothetical protein